MFPSNPSSHERGKHTVESSLHGLASVLALIAALMASGQIWEFTADPVHRYLLRTYGDPSLATLGTWVWGILASAAVFFIARALIVLSLLIIAERSLLLAF